MNLQKLMKQAQAMQAGVAQVQSRLSEKRFSAEAAGGKVKAIADGAGNLVQLSIDRPWSIRTMRSSCKPSFLK